MFACVRTDSVLFKNRTGSSALVPENSGREALAARKSSYGINTDRSCICGANDEKFRELYSEAVCPPVKLRV
jgi:hypothetical protein